MTPQFDYLIGHDVPTEQRNESTLGIDRLATGELVTRLIDANATIHRAVAAQSGQLSAAVEAALISWVAGGVIHYAGAGTSGRLAVLDAVELLPTYGVGEDRVRAHLAGGAAAMMHAVEGAEDDRAAGEELGSSLVPTDLMFGVTASGRTPFVAGALSGARSRGATTILLASNPAAELAALADIAILPDTGPEVITGSTRMNAATAQKIVLNTFSTALMVRCGKTFDNLMIDVRATNEKLRARTVRMIVQASGISPEEARTNLTEAGGHIAPALVMALAGVDLTAAKAALAAFPPDPHRAADPSGIRSALTALG